jgi:hypothetical protein
MNINTLKSIFLSLILLASFSVHAARINIYAKANSSSPNGGGLNTGLYFKGGEIFAGSANPNDLWAAGNRYSSGSDTRWSNADGLIKNLYASGRDDSGKRARTLIGKNYGTWTQNGYTAAYGALVGKISDVYYTLGTKFRIKVKKSGKLRLFFWDKNNRDNQGKITVNISKVTPPKPKPRKVTPPKAKPLKVVTPPTTTTTSSDVPDPEITNILNTVIDQTPAQTNTVTPVPLPPSVLLMISGFLGLLGFKKRNK